MSSDPLNGQDGVGTIGSVTLHFNKPVNPFSFQQGQFMVPDLTSGDSASGYLLQPQAQPDDATLVFNMNLSLGHAYQFQFPASGDHRLAGKSALAGSQRYHVHHVSNRGEIRPGFRLERGPQMAIPELL